jgi:hypothetical protein
MLVQQFVTQYLRNFWNNKLVFIVLLDANNNNNFSPEVAYFTGSKHVLCETNMLSSPSHFNPF